MWECRYPIGHWWYRRALGFVCVFCGVEVARIPKEIPYRCLHLRRVNVDLKVTGEIVAQICLDCNEQLSA